MDSIVNYCVAASGYSVLYNTRLEKLSVADDGMIKTLTLESENGYVASYNAVVITIPVPQALALDGVLELLDKKPILKKNLECVHYSSRYAVALHFESDFEIPVPWTAKYVCGNDAIRFVCWDSRKRNPQSGGPHSLLVHSSVPFAVEHLEEERAKVEETLIDRVQMLFSWLPKPTWSRCHRWRYSQVKQSYSGIPGYVTIGQSPPLLFGGDGFNHSNFDGCVESAAQIVNALIKMPILSL
ncbi:renalase-like [Corticium candelabrum]|uniref:renalase-like n=1 Tax=Corticium candelabrum TaxID=121492 RepID=UPI002E252D3A|nr:renalase-like [Corticium candelabrum]